MIGSELLHTNPYYPFLQQNEYESSKAASIVKIPDNYSYYDEIKSIAESTGAEITPRSFGVIISLSTQITFINEFKLNGNKSLSINALEQYINDFKNDDDSDSLKEPELHDINGCNHQHG